LAFRAQIILVVADGLSNKAAAGRLTSRPATISKWSGRFARHGLAGIAEAPRSGKPRHYDSKDERRVLAALDASLPKGYARWSGPLLAEHLGDISKHRIWRMLRQHEISLERRRRWCISTDPAISPGRVPGSRAWMCGFSSTANTTAFSGGCGRARRCPRPSEQTGSLCDAYARSYGEAATTVSSCLATVFTVAG
jgi:transposase